MTGSHLGALSLNLRIMVAPGDLELAMETAYLAATFVAVILVRLLYTVSNGLDIHGTVDLRLRRVSLTPEEAFGGAACHWQTEWIIRRTRAYLS